MKVSGLFSGWSFLPKPNVVEVFMKRSSIALLRELLVTQMNFWTFFPLMLTAYILMGILPGNEVRIALECLLMGILPFGLFFVRRSVQNQVVFALLHVGFLILLFFVPSGDVMTLFVRLVAGVVILGYSFYLRVRFDVWEDRAISPIISVLIAGTCLFLQQYLEYHQWKGIVCTVFVIVLSLYYLIYYIESFLNFLMVNEQSASHIPEREMFRSGIRLAFGYTILGAAFLLLTADISWLRQILELCKRVFIAVLQLLFMLFSFGNEPEELHNIDPRRMGAQAFYPDGSESFWLWDMFTYVAVFLILFGILRAIWKGILRAVRYLREHWNMQADGLLDITVPEVADVRERLQLGDKKKKKRQSIRKLLSINERVRRLYRREVELLELDTDIVRCMTARECAGQLQAPALGQVYEKARYSGQNCTAEELKQAKAACR